MTELDKHTVTFGDIDVIQTASSILLQNKNTADKYVDFNKTENLFYITGGISIGSKFNKIVLSKEDGVYIPNCAHFNYNGGQIANGKIHWDKKTINFADGIIPIKALDSSDLTKYIEHHIKNINLSSMAEKGPKGDRGINGDDGYSIITLMDSIHIITDGSNNVAYDSDIKIPIKVLCGKRESLIKVNIIDSIKGIKVSSINNGFDSVIIIEAKRGDMLHGLFGVIRYEIIVDDYIIFQRGINWMTCKEHEKVIIEKNNSVPFTQEPKIIHNEPKSEPISIIYGGGIFIEDEAGNVYPKNIEYLLKTVNMGDYSPKWYYKYSDEWILLDSNKGKYNLIIHNNDEVLLNYKHVSYKAEFDNGESSVVSTSIVKYPISTYHEVVSNNVEVKNTNMIEITPNRKDYALLKIGSDMELDTNNQNTIVINEIAKVSDNFTDSLSKTFYVCSDRICKDDYPLSANLVKGQEYTLIGDLDMVFLCPNVLGEISYEVETKIISNNEAITKDTSNGVVKINDRASKSVSLHIPFTATDKTIRLGISINLKSSHKGKNINISLSVNDIVLETAKAKFNIGTFGMQYFKNANNYFNIENVKQGLRLSYKTTTKDSSLLPVIGYGSVCDKGIDSIYGPYWDTIKGYWSSIRNGFIFRLNFEQNMNKKYMISVNNTSSDMYQHTIRKMDKYAEIEFHCEKQPTFDFIIFGTP